MNRHNRATLTFYLVALIIAILSGLKFEFNAGSHTAPMPILIEMFIISVGLVWLFIETIIVSMKRIQTWKDIMGHVVGLTMNAGFVVYQISPALFSLVDILY